MPKHLLLIFLLAIALSGCNPFGSETTQKILTVFAAASLTDVFTAIGAEFEATNPDVVVRFNFAGSSQLAAQINNGAPGDIFASADVVQMTVVEDAGNLDQQPLVFANNSLVIISSTERVTTIPDLAQGGVRFITAADGVPIREYSNQVLANLSTDTAYGPNFATHVLSNIVSEENNVRQVVLKTSLGEADAAIVYASDITPDVESTLTIITIPPQYNVEVQYPIAVLKGSGQKGLAQQFIDFVLAADSILITWGLQPVE